MFKIRNLPVLLLALVISYWQPVTINACDELFEGFGIHLGSIDHLVPSRAKTIPQVVHRIYNDLGISPFVTHARHYRTSLESTFSPSSDVYEIACGSNARICSWIDIQNEISKYPDISVMGSIWSPPAYMMNTTSHRLPVDRETNFHHFIGNVTQLIKAKFNITIERVSPINEPENLLAAWEHTVMAIFLLFVTLASAVEIESNGKSIEKKQEKRGISSLGYGYGSSGLGGYDNGFGGYAGLANGAYGTPVSYNRVHYTTGGYNGGYGGYSGLSPYSGYSGVGGVAGIGGYSGGYNGIYNGGYNSAYNGGYRSGYSGIYNRGGLGYSGLGTGYSTLGSGYNSFGSGYSGLGYSSDGYSSVYPYSRVAGLVGSSPYTGYAANGGYVY